MSETLATEAPPMRTPEQTFRTYYESMTESELITAAKTETRSSASPRTSSKKNWSAGE